MPANLRSAYRKLVEKNKNLIVLGSAEAIIHWDMETMMPPKAVELRSQQLALLSTISHKMSTDPEIGNLLKQIKTNPEFDTLHPGGAPGGSGIQVGLKAVGIARLS